MMGNFNSFEKYGLIKIRKIPDWSLLYFHRFGPVYAYQLKNFWRKHKKNKEKRLSQRLSVDKFSLLLEHKFFFK